MKRLLLLLILLIPIYPKAEELRGYTFVIFKDLIDNYGITEAKIVDDIFHEMRVDLGNTFHRTYYNPPRKYLTEVLYTGSFRELKDDNKKFLMDWFNVSERNLVFDSSYRVGRDSGGRYLSTFYEETCIIYRGKTYCIPIQRAIANSMRSNLKSGDTILISVLLLGRRTMTVPTMIIVGYDKNTNIGKDKQEIIDLDTEYKAVKDSISRGNWENAAALMQGLLKKYPENMSFKLDMCFIRSRQANINIAINCYNEIIATNNDSYRAYSGLGALYFNSKMEAGKKYRLAIDNFDRAIALIKNPNEDDRLLLYSDYYMRGMSKLHMKDKTAIDDFIFIYRERPDLVDRESVLSIARQLGVTIE